MESPVTNRIPSQKTSNVNLWCFLGNADDEAVEQTVERSLIIIWVIFRTIFFLIFAFYSNMKEKNHLHLQRYIVCGHSTYVIKVFLLATRKHNISVWLIIKPHHNMIKPLYGEFSRSYISHNSIRSINNCITYEQPGKGECRSHFVLCIPFCDFYHVYETNILSKFREF